MPEISVVCMVNRPQEYRDCLHASTLADGDRIQHVVVEGATSGATGLNQGLDRATCDLVMCAHQDVWLKTGWLDRLLALVADLDRRGPWGVAGMAGTQEGGRSVGSHSGLGMPEGMSVVEVQTLDESTVVMRRSRGLRFCEDIPYFHRYAVEIALTGWRRGLPAYVIDVPMEHRTRWTAGPGLHEASQAVRRQHPEPPTIYTTTGVF